VAATSTQTRILLTTHERLARLADETGKTHQEVIDTALRAYERDLFLDQLNEGFAKLRADDGAWQSERAERADWDVTLNES